MIVILILMFIVSYLASLFFISRSARLRERIAAGERIREMRQQAQLQGFHPLYILGIYDAAFAMYDEAEKCAPFADEKTKERFQ